MHALVPANPDLVNPALLRGELSDQAEKNRKEIERMVHKLLLTVEKETIEAEIHVKEMAALRQRVVDEADGIWTERSE